jgi:hypothetical protein
MTRQEFEQWLAGEPNIWNTIRESAGKIPPNTVGAEGELTDDVILAVMHPVVSFVLTEIGLPWRHEPREYADLWRQKFRSWLAAESDDLNLHPYAIESAGTELRGRLGDLSDKSERASWERLAEALK